MSKRSRVIGSPADGAAEGEAGPSRAAGRPRPVPQDDQMDDDDKPLPTPAERGLTLETFTDRPVTGDKHLLAKLKPLIKGFDTARQRVDDSMTHLQSTAVSLADAGMMENEELFNSIDQSFRVCLDELAMIDLREQQLDKIYKDLLEDGNEITDVQGVYRDGCEKREDEYKAKSEKAKYGKNPKYHTFLERVWESRGTGDPMPLLSTLFAKDERGAANGDAATNGGEESDSDSDIELGGAVTSFKCPLTLKPMVDPWTSTVCPHSFEKVAIQEFVKRGNPTCPASGCNAKLGPNKIKENSELRRRAEADTRRTARQREERENSAEEIDSAED